MNTLAEVMKLSTAMTVASSHYIVEELKKLPAVEWDKIPTFTVTQTQKNAIDALPLSYFNINVGNPSLYMCNCMPFKLRVINAAAVPVPERKYSTGRGPNSHLFDIYQWNSIVEDGSISSDDGTGYWVKDGLESFDDPFTTPQLDATHVAWYNK